MRIAGKIFSPVTFSAFAAVVAVLGLSLSAAKETFAAPPAPALAASPAPVSQAPIASAQAAPTAAPAAPAAAPTTSNVIPSAFQVPEAPKSEGDDIAKALSSMEDKVTDNAKSLVKKLDTTEPTTISDLNAAKQTVTRIEAMIDIEKRLGELDKLRNERNSRAFGGALALPAGVPAGGLAAAIPASALQPLPGAITAMPVSGSPDSPPVFHVGSGRPEISRISGTEGRYVAVLKMPDGEKKAVKAGEKFSHGTVRAITSSSVEIADKGTSYTLRVKNVDAIYSAMR